MDKTILCRFINTPHFTGIKFLEFDSLVDPAQLLDISFYKFKKYCRHIQYINDNSLFSDKLIITLRKLDDESRSRLNSYLNDPNTLVYYTSSRIFNRLFLLQSVANLIIDNFTVIES